MGWQESRSHDLAKQVSNKVLFFEDEQIGQPADQITKAKAAMQAFRARAASIDSDRPWTAPNAVELDRTTIRAWCDNNSESRLSDFELEWLSVVGGSGGFDPLGRIDPSFGLTQAVAPQDEGPEAWLLNGAAGQVAERLTNELRTFIHLNSPVHGIDQNAVGVTVHIGGDQQIQAKKCHRRGPTTTAEQDHLQARPSCRDARFPPAQSNGFDDQGVRDLSIGFWRDQNLNGFASAT